MWGLHWIALFLSWLTKVHLVITGDECEKPYRYMYKDGDYILVNIVPLSYNGYRTAHLMIAETTVYAINEANKLLLPGEKTLGYYIFDSKDAYLFETLTRILLHITLGDSTPMKSITNSSDNCYCPMLPFTSRNKIIGIVGTGTSHSTEFISSMLSFTQLPIISYWATSIEFNDRERYPRVFRTISDDGQLARVLVDILKKLNINFVSIISSDEHYGRSGRQELLKYLNQHRICIDFDIQIKLPVKKYVTSRIVKKLLDRGKRLQILQTVIIFAWSDVAQNILQAASRLKMYETVWVLSSFDSFEMGSSIDPRVLNGSITAVADSGIYADFYEHFWGHLSSSPHILPGWTHKYKEELKLDDVLIEKTMDVTTQFYLAGYVRNAVFTYASAIAKYINANNCSHRTCNLDLDQFFNIYLNSSGFTGLDGETILFDINGALQDPAFRIYDIFTDNNQRMIFTEVVKTKQGQLSYMHNRTHWIDKKLSSQTTNCSRECNPGKQPFTDIGNLCCWVCRKCDQGFYKPMKGVDSCIQCPSGYSNEQRTQCLTFKLLYVSDFIVPYFVFLVISFTGGLLCILAIMLILNHRNKAFVRAMDFKYSLFQVCSQLVLFMITVYAITTETTSFVCHIHYFFVSSTLTLIFSFLLAKSEQLISIFSAKTIMSRREILFSRSKSYLLIFLTIILDLLITTIIYVILGQNVIFTAHNPLTLQKEVYCVEGYLIYSKSTYTAVILTISGLQAFRSRNLPARFNESKSLLSIIFTSALYLFGFGFVIHYEIHSPTKYTLFLGIAISFSNITILLLTYFVKFWTHLTQKGKQRTKRILQHRGINFETYLKSYKSRASKRRNTQVDTIGLDLF